MCVFRRAARERQILARAVAMLDAVSSKKVPAWPIWMETRSTRPRSRRRLVTRFVLLNFRVELLAVAEVLVKADLIED
jgi:hypothetical protein